MADAEGGGTRRRRSGIRRLQRAEVGPGPLQRLKDQLYELYLRANQPTLEQVHNAIADDDSLAGSPSTDTIRRYISSPARPDEWADLDALVTLLARMARVDVPSAVAQAKEHWVQAGLDRTTGAVGLNPTMRAAYLGALIARYRVVELSTLTPEGLDEQLPVWLSQVFEPQRVRTVSVAARRFPHLELPRDLWRRLIESGDIDPDELPADLDPEQLRQIRREHLDQPARPVFDVLAEHARQGRVALLGDPGSGKSSMLAYLALALAGNELPQQLSEWTGWLPILVELREYADPAWRTGRWADGTLLDFLDHAEQHHGLGLPRDELKSYLRSDGRAVVMFDGLDELFDAAQREQTARAIAAFAGRYPKATVLVTSRPIGYRRGVLDAAGFTLHTVDDLDRPQIDTFVERWYRLTYHGDPHEADVRAARLQASLDRSRSAAVLAGNPLLLTILCIIGRRRELPRERHRVYEHAVSVLVQHWDPSRHLHDSRLDLDETDRRRLLEQIADRMQRGHGGIAGNHIHYDDLLTEFRHYLTDVCAKSMDVARPAAAGMIDQLRERNFILSRYGPGMYGFVHRAFLEYCAAAAITFRLKEEQSLTTEDMAELFGRYATDSTWSETLLLLAGMLHPNVLRRILDHLLDQAERPSGRVGRHRGWHLMLALRCLAETRTLADLNDQARRATAELIHQIASGNAIEGSQFRESIEGESLVGEAALIFDELGPEFPGAELMIASIAKLEKAVAPNDLLGRQQSQLLLIAARLSARSVGSPTTLVERASTDESWASRRAAVNALAAGWPDEATRTVLGDRATTDESWIVRRAAVEALVAGWPDEATRVLVERATTIDEVTDGRLAALKAVAAGWPDEATRTLLVERATYDRDEAVRVLALQALAAGWPDQATRIVVERAITDAEEDVRRSAVQVLAAGWPDEATRHLLAERVAKGDLTGQQAAAEELAARWPDNSTRILLIKLISADELVLDPRALVLALAAGWPDEATRALLIELTTEGDIGRRQGAVEALAERWPDRASRTVLVERATTDRSWLVRRAAVTALAAGWPDEATRALLFELATAAEEWTGRKQAAAALAAGWSDEATRALLIELATTDKSWNVRRTAMQALVAQWPDETTRTLLIELATADKHMGVWREAVEVLVAGWPDETTRTLLVELATTAKEQTTQRAALEVLVAGWPDETTRTLLRTSLVERTATDEQRAAWRAEVQELMAGWPDRATLRLAPRAPTDSS